MVACSKGLCLICAWGKPIYSRQIRSASVVGYLPILSVSPGICLLQCLTISSGQRLCNFHSVPWFSRLVCRRPWRAAKRTNALTFMHLCMDTHWESYMGMQAWKYCIYKRTHTETVHTLKPVWKLQSRHSRMKSVNKNHGVKVGRNSVIITPCPNCMRVSNRCAASRSIGCSQPET